MFPVQQRVDHRVLEMGPTPPRHERIGIALPPLPREERGCGFGQSSLHVDHGSILVEHANLDGSSHIIRLRHPCSLEMLWRATADRQTQPGAYRYEITMPRKSRRSARGMNSTQPPSGQGSSTEKSELARQFDFA